MIAFALLKKELLVHCMHTRAVHTAGSRNNFRHHDTILSFYRGNRLTNGFLRVKTMVKLNYNLVLLALRPSQSRGACILKKLRILFQLLPFSPIFPSKMTIVKSNARKKHEKTKQTYGIILPFLF